MFRLWKPGRSKTGNYHVARAHEERVRALLAKSDAARAAHLKLSELHEAASRNGIATGVDEPRRELNVIRIRRLPALIAGPRPAGQTKPLLALPHGRAAIIELHPGAEIRALTDQTAIGTP